MKNKNRVNLNAYLFANLVVLCFLLIGIWNKKPVWDTSIRFPNLLLILVIINTVLIFKEFILGTAARKISSRKQLRKTASLRELRVLIDDFEEPSEKFLEATLNKTCKLSGASGMMMLVKENEYFKTVAKTENLPPVLPGIKFVIQDMMLIAKYPGNLGTETLIELKSYRQKSFKFVSKVTRFDAIIVPLWLKGGKPGLWIISGYKPNIKISIASAALNLEMAYALVQENIHSSKGMYKDATTGLLLNDCFENSFETEIERAERYQQEMSLLSVRITNYDDAPEENKAQILAAIAKAMKLSLRRLDLMFCGKEKIDFLAILTETNIESAKIVAERIQKAFTKEVKKIDSDLDIKICIGGATYPSDATHGAGLKENSAEALNEAISNKSDYFEYSSFTDRT